VATEVCDLNPEDSVVLPTFQSVTFTRDDRLLAGSSGDNSLWEVFLPSCDIVKIDNYSLPSLLIPGICPDEENDLFGLSTGNEALYRIDSNTAEVTLVGYFGITFGNVGGTWVEEEQEVYSITNVGSEDGLMHVDKTDGAATLLAYLTEDFGSVGMEHHPHNEVIYACTNPSAGPGWESAPLFQVDLDGTVTLVGLTGLPGNCDNLGAPWGNPPLPLF
jgi:hypothetical protein